jgi:hypothetical protein
MTKNELPKDKSGVPRLPGSPVLAREGVMRRLWAEMLKRFRKLRPS